MSAQWGNLKSNRRGARVMNALRRAGCPNIDVALEWTDKSLLQIPGIGPEVIKRLRQESQKETDTALTFTLNLTSIETAFIIWLIKKDARVPLDHSHRFISHGDLLSKIVNQIG